MNKPQRTIELTPDELERLGDTVADSLQTINLIISSLNLSRSPMEVAKNSDKAGALLEYDALYKATDSTFHSLQSTAKKLDDVAHLLISNDDKLEVNGMREKGRI